METSGSSVLLRYWEYAMDHFPFGHYWIQLYYTIHAHFTLFNVMVFLMKCIPVGVYIYKFIKNVSIASRKRWKLHRIKIEDIKLQIQIVNTKLKLCEAEFAERTEILRRKEESLRKVRKRVQEIIAADELGNTINTSSPWESERNCNINNTPEEDSKFFVELLKELKDNQVVVPEKDINKNYRDHPDEHVSAENSGYFSVQDVDSKQDYHVKIVRVTNVYKVAYLRHFMKQNKLRRANKQALLRKKMDKIKKLFDDWQQALKMVINSKPVNLEHQLLEIASQSARGDFSKPNFNNSLDTDSECRNSVDYQNEYGANWMRNQHGIAYNDDFNMNIRQECYDFEECFNKYNSDKERSYCNTTAKILLVVPEETTSQVEIEDINIEKQ